MTLTLEEINVRNRVLTDLAHLLELAPCGGKATDVVVSSPLQIGEADQLHSLLTRFGSMRGIGRPVRYNNGEFCYRRYRGIEECGGKRNPQSFVGPETTKAL